MTLPRRRHLSLLPLAALSLLGALALAEPPSAWAAPPPTITVLSPAPGSVVGQDAEVQVQVQSPIYQITAVKAQTAFGTYDMYLQGSIWYGNIPLYAAGWGSQTITFIATYSNQQVTGTLSVLHDLPPTVKVGASLEGTVTPGDVHVDATCVDDAPSGCAVELSYRGQVVASGPSPFNQAISLASFAPSQEDGLGDNELLVRVKDSAGYIAETHASVYVLPLTPARTEVYRIPEGQIVDLNDAWILYRDLQSYHMYNRSTKQDTVVAPKKEVAQVRLTSSGALIGDYAKKTVYEWKNGTLVDLNVSYESGLIVNGSYAVWQYSVPWVYANEFLDIFVRRDLLTGTNDEIEGDLIVNPFLTYSMWADYVAPNGDLFIGYLHEAGFGNFLNLKVWYPAATGKAVELGPGGCVEANLATDGHLVALGCAPEPNGTGPHPVLAVGDLDTSPVLQTIFDAPEQATNDPPTPPKAVVNNGWLAYERCDGITCQVWRRSPDGEEEQVSLLGGSSGLLLDPSSTLSPSGELAFAHDGSIWFSKPGEEATKGWNNTYRDGKWYFVIGRSVFLENEGASGSSSSTGAGGSGSATSAGSSTSAGGGGAGGSGSVTSASGAGTAGASMNGGAGAPGAAEGSSAQGGCSFSGARGGREGLSGLGLFGLAALAARRRRSVHKGLRVLFGGGSLAKRLGGLVR